MASGSSRSPTVQSANTDSRAAPNPTAADERLRRTPLWKYVKVIQKNSTTGGNARSECLFCGHVIPGSYFRVRAHLLKESNKGTSICSAVNDELLEELRKEDAAAKAAEASSQNRSVPMPIQIPFADSSSALPPQGARSAKRKKAVNYCRWFPSVSILNFGEWPMPLLQDCSTLEVVLFFLFQTFLWFYSIKLDF